MVFKDEKQFIKAALKEGRKVIEVAIKGLYITHAHETLTESKIKEQWFGKEAINNPHAYRDGSHVGNLDKLVSIRFITTSSFAEKKETGCGENLMLYRDTTPMGGSFYAQEDKFTKKIMFAVTDADNIHALTLSQVKELNDKLSAWIIKNDKL